MLSKINEFVKAHIDDLIIFIIIVLVALLAFAGGYIVAKYQTKKPIQIQQNANP